MATPQKQKITVYFTVGTKPSKFSTIEEALQSIIPDIKETTSTDAKDKPSNNNSRTPACCIHPLLIDRKSGLLPKQWFVFLTSKLYTAQRLYNNPPLAEVLNKFYTWYDWNNYWKDHRVRYRKELHHEPNDLTRCKTFTQKINCSYNSCMRSQKQLICSFRIILQLLDIVIICCASKLF